MFPELTSAHEPRAPIRSENERSGRLLGFFALGAIVFFLSAYLGVYIWARNDGLFWGGIPHYGPEGPERDLYHVMPIGNMSVILAPDRTLPEAEQAARQKEFRATLDRSKVLWPWFSGVAGVEQWLRRTFDAK